MGIGGFYHVAVAIGLLVGILNCLLGGIMTCCIVVWSKHGLTNNLLHVWISLSYAIRYFLLICWKHSGRSSFLIFPMKIGIEWGDDSF